MHFLVDAQLSRRLVKRFSDAGYVASHVYDHLPFNAKDSEIAQLANQLGACVVTKDADFADMSRRGLLDRTVVWLRMPNGSTETLWSRVEKVLPAIVMAIKASTRIVEIR